ncbi:hypothetical protein PVAND_015305 [Polypedilum vanderplanki]|uniref:Protein hunchback n=1 Tax=Polypedilum vanderplanki TaxID=319348 RepID=A0A9J6BBS4_POLVA|nr:hypothetical protein PVAND_015305 [Polypedilum vanderplanki]
MTTIIDQNSLFIKIEPEDDCDASISEFSNYNVKEKEETEKEIENKKSKNSKNNSNDKSTKKSSKDIKVKQQKQNSKSSSINKRKSQNKTTEEQNEISIKSEPEDEKIDDDGSSKIQNSSNESKNILEISNTIISKEFNKNLKKSSNKTKQSREKSQQQTFICSICNIIFDTKQKFSSHMKIHKEATHQCSKCDRKFKSEKHVAKHECAICKICGHKSKTRSDLKVHMKQNHSEAANKIYTVQCDYCGKHIKTKTYLIHHIRAEHIKDEKTHLLCTLCGTKVPHKFLLDKHMLIKHSEMVTCKLCGKMVKPLCMPYHMKQVHATDRNFLCTICSASFKTKSNFRDHMRTHNKPHACDLCDKIFARPDHLREHRILHYDPHAYSCQICNHHFSTIGYLKKHMKAHEESNVKCKICGIDVNVLSLNYHMKNSHPFDRFQCSKCGATGFGNHREFSEHLRIHEKERVENEKAEIKNSSIQKRGSNLKKTKVIRKEEEEIQAVAIIEAQNRESTKNNSNNLDEDKEEIHENLKSNQNSSKNFDKNLKNLHQIKTNNKTTKPSLENTKEAKEFTKIITEIEEKLEENQSENSFDGFEYEADNMDCNYHSPNETLQPEIQPEILPKDEIKEEQKEAVKIEQFQNPFDVLICDVISKPRKRQRKVKSLEPQPRFILIPKNSIVTCDLCGESFDKKTKLITHIRQHVRENENHQCQICYKFFITNSILQTHMRSHIDILVPCEICGKQVKPHCMPNHIRQVHTTFRNLECHICGKVFKTKQNLREHLKHHNKAFQCAVCGRKFPRSTDLNEHMISHENPEAFDCPHCNLRLADRRSLKKHIENIHIAKNDGSRVKQEKIFKCELCDYSCVQKGNLKIHYKKHEKYQAKLRANPDALKCEICEALFRSELILKIHMQKVHSDERFPCGHCENVLKTKSSLWSHLRKVHQIEPEKRKKKEKSEKVQGEKKKRRKRRKRNENGELVEREEIENNVKVIEIHSVADMEYY